MFRALLAVALEAAAGAVASRAVLGFFFYSGNFILLVEVVSVCLPSVISLASVCFRYLSECHPSESEKGKKSRKDNDQETKRHSSENRG